MASKELEEREKQLIEECKELRKTTEKIDVENDKIEVIGIKLMLLELAIHQINEHIGKYVEEKVKNLKESEEK